MPDQLINLLDTLSLTWTGVGHSLFSVAALLAGLLSLLFFGRIRPDSAFGRIYLVSTALVCATGFFIFQHDGFGKPHILGILTIVVLYIGGLANQTRLFGRASLQMEAIAFSLTYFFHILAAITEVGTRYPIEKAWITDREGPEIKIAALGCLGAFVLVAIPQAWFLRKK